MSKQVGKVLKPEFRFPEFRDAREWAIKPLNKLFTIGSGKDYKHLSSGDVPVYGSGGYMRSVNAYLYDGESACIGRKGTINNPIFLTGKFWTVDTLFYTHSFKECLPKFAYLIFQNINWLTHNEAGGVPSLSKTNIYKIEVAVPSPDEQEKIVECIVSIDELITEQYKKIVSLKAHKKGLMQKLFPTDGETVPKLRFPEFRGAGEWERKQLKKVFSIFQGFAFSSKDSVTEGVRWLKIADVSIQKMNHNSPSFLPAEHEEKHKKFSVKQGDYVIALTRPVLSKQLKMAPVDKVFNGALLNQRVGKLVTIQNSAFVYYLLQTSKLISDIEKSISGSEPPNLSAQQIEGIKTYIPSNKKEQEKIADCLSSIDDLMTEQDKKIILLKAHKKGLMQQLFPVTDEVNE